MADFGSNLGETVETLRFAATAEPTVQITEKGSTVTRFGPGVYDVHLPPFANIDPLSRTVVVVKNQGPAFGRAEEINDAATADDNVRVGTWGADEQPADTGAAVTVTIFRARAQ